MYADAQVGARTADVEQTWAVVVQAYEHGQEQERGVTDCLTLMEAIDYAQVLHAAFEREGWADNEWGGHSKDGRLVYIFVDGNGGAGLEGAEK